ncbi:MAG: hypothetical protein HFI72_04290 [Peptococcaceae bacterium]|nr:hypothetical protein [Peptococcaceae bacterium]
MCACIFAGCGEEEIVSMGTVNGVAIDQSKFDFYMDNLKSQYGSIVDLTEVNEENKAVYAMIEQSAWDTIVQNTLVEALAQAEGIQVTGAEVENALDAQVKASFDSEQGFNDWLKAMGYTRDEMLYLFRMDALSQKLFDKVTADISISDEEAKAAYDANKEDWQKVSVSHILFKADRDNASEEELNAARDKAKDIIKRLDNGEDFATLAREYSEDTSAPAGGAMDYKFSRNDTKFVKEFVDGTFQLHEVGEYSKEPVQSQFGFHIIKIDTKDDDFESVKEEVKDSLAAPLKTEAYYAYMDEKSLAAEVVVDYTFQYWTEGNEGNNANPFAPQEND